MNPHHPREVGANTHEHLPGEPMTEKISLTKGRKIFVMQCGFHAFMESWAVAVTNPYYEITDAHGAYAIYNIPPGTYRVLAWHPQTGTLQERVVTVEPNAVTYLNLALPAPKGRRTVYQVIENPRFGNGARGRPIDIRPIVEHQQ
jgi:hypothetical protein